MSADNWAVCPCCKKRAEAEYQRQRTEIVENWGGNPDDMLGMLDAVKRPVPRDYATFREDYEIYGAETGTVTVYYGGSCETCGLSLKFDHKHEIPGANE